MNKEEDVHSNDNSVLQEMFKEEDDTAIEDTSDTATLLLTNPMRYFGNVAIVILLTQAFSYLQNDHGYIPRQ